ncbi:MAG: YvrJ family protein [Clostridiales bacterium]|nr:YvrJ family protein [Clostridiales bacterium]
MEQVLGLIANLGFPIAVSVYLLVRIENRMESLTQSIHQLAEAVALFKG